jgi:uncharacterized membrane protein YgcG
VNRVFRILAMLVGLLALQQPASAEERILDFDSVITVARDGTLEVRETLRVRAEGNRIRRGIFREFPTIYQAADGRQIVVGFQFIDATRDGNAEPWRTEQLGNGVRVYLGSAAVQLPEGEHVYVLTYRTDRQMGYFADHDELYWNVTGNGWAFSIDKATATVLLPDTIPRDQIKMEAYTGPQGSKGKDYRAELRDGAPHYQTRSGLGEREGLTIVASWPKGHIHPGVEIPVPMTSPVASPGYDFARDAGQAPDTSHLSIAEQVLGRELPRSNAPFWIALIGVLLLLGYYYFIWDRVGRDPPAKVIIPEYTPPADQSPASMRYVLRMGYDHEVFGAAVLSLAVKGYLTIQQDAGALGFGKTFTLVRNTAPKGKPLTADEQVLLGQLFQSGDSLVLKQENHRAVIAARSSHYRSLKSQYKAGFFRINGGWHVLGIFLSIIVLVLSVAFPGNDTPWIKWYLVHPMGWATIALALFGILSNGLFGWLLRARTPKGQAAYEHILGFKMYLEVAEGEELKRAGAPPPPLTPELFESFLPAALALDVEQKWSERFARVLDIQDPNYQPAWYAGPGFRAANLGAFSSGLGNSLKSAISSSSTAPGSKSGGGGGGSSGGGGGGGGGGGW